MAGARLPGSAGTNHDKHSVDPKIARPAHICLFSSPVQPKKDKSKRPAHKAQKKLGIEVHESSQISAADWLLKIRNCDRVPDYFKDQIKTNDQDRLIFLTNPERFAFPLDVIPKSWLSDWLSAFVVEEWVMTTGNLVIFVESNGKITGDLQPDLLDSEAIDGWTRWAALGERGDTKKFNVEFGDTLPDGVTLSSRRQKLIVVANRITLRLGDKGPRLFNPTNDEMVNTWFHEIACHAGRETQQKPSGHGDATVDRTWSEIDDMIPAKVTTDKIASAIDDFLKPSKK